MTELKTLKDLEQYECLYGDNGGLELASTYPIDKETPIELGMGEDVVIKIKELRKEAIKRVKLYIKQYNETPENMIKTRAVISGREEAIRDFFNITEEDLK